MKRIKILIVSSSHYSYFSLGGAFISLRNLVDGLKEDKRFLIRILSRESKEMKQGNLTISPFNSFMTHIYDKIRKVLRIFGLNFYIHFLQILKEIKGFKPHIIIAQLETAFATITCAKIKHIPVIHIIRDCYNFCPVYANIESYGKGCKGLRDKKTCYKCIENWRTLRTLISNKVRGKERSLKYSILTIFYKLKYYINRVNYYLSDKSTINIVASPIMKRFLSLGMNPEKIRVLIINPIRRRNLPSLKKGNKILFTIVPGIIKGGHFILRLSKIISGLNINAIGIETDNKNIICLDTVPNKDLDILYRNASITLVPSFWVEAFGRVVIESLVNGTPVITSPNVGANDYFIGKDYVKSVPLKLELWKDAIMEMIKDPPVINNKDIEDIYRKFSINSSKRDFIKLIMDVLKNEYI